MPIATTRYPRFGIGKKVPLLGLDQINPTRHFRRGGPFWRAKRSDKDSMLWSSDDGDGWMLFLANQTPFYANVQTQERCAWKSLTFIHENTYELIASWLKFPSISVQLVLRADSQSLLTGRCQNPELPNSRLQGKCPRLIPGEMRSCQQPPNVEREFPNRFLVVIHFAPRLYIYRLDS